MKFPAVLLSSLFAAAVVASPVAESVQSIQKRDCFHDCVDNCNPPPGGNCNLACLPQCYLDYNNGFRTTVTNLDEYIHNRNGRLSCHGHTGS